MNLRKYVALATFLGWGIQSLLASVNWTPVTPTKFDSVRITVTNCTVGAKLHWGVNGWTAPASVYWPQGSLLWSDGAAIESPMSGPSNGTCTITIGPFDNPAQPVTEVDFVIHFNDGSWDNNNSQDYKIKFMSGDVVWSPSAPGPNDTVTIHIGNATKSGKLHWGVNAVDHLWTRPISDYWPPQTVLWSDSTAVETPLQGPGTGHTSEIQLGPFRSGKQLVQSLDFVIHWADDTWDNNDGSDYHIYFSFEPAPGDPKVVWTSLAENDILGKTVSLAVNAVNADTVEYWYDGHLIAHTTAPFTVEWQTDGVPFGKRTLYARAVNAAGRVSFSLLHVWKLPEIVHAQAPSGTQPGINYHSDGTVTLALFAPYKNFVLIQGDFNHWNGSNTVMNVQDDGLWWKTLSLPTGKHEYQYVVDGSLIIADPFSEDVDWTANGKEDWHPENARTVLPVPKPQFQWEDRAYTPLPKSDYVIYEIHVGDFSPAGTFQGLIEKLDYIRDLGMTAIELMPTYEFPGGHSWGYNPAFYMAPESSYGTPEDFKRLINEAHKRGIAVLMDMVYNHSDATCPLYLLYKNDYAHSPYYHAVNNMWGFPDFDHYKPATQKFVDRVNKFWMQEYHIDGFRFDYTRGYDQTSETGNLNLLNRMAVVAHLNNPKAYLIAEHLPQDPAVATSTQMDAEWHDTFHDQMKANLREGSFEGSSYANLANTARAIDFALDGFSAPTQVINYLESHDEQRVVWEVRTNPSISYDLALQKSRLGAAVLFTAAGNPMMYMGEEFGMDTPKTLDWNKLKWGYLSQPKTKKLFEFYRRIIQFRNKHRALREGTVRILKKFVAQKTIVYERKSENQRIVVAANFSRSPQKVDIPLDGQSHWYEFVVDSDLGIADTLKGFMLPGSSARIFTNFLDWPLSVKQKRVAAGLPRKFELFQNYPNPFNPTTQIRYWLPKEAVVKLEIFNLTGQLVAVPVNSRQTAGVYSVRWKAEGLPGGVYFYRLKAGDFVSMRKMLLLH